MEENHYAFPDLGEFRLIDRLLRHRPTLSKVSPKHRFWLDAGDDAAGVDGWLITKDLSVENTHFRLDFSTIEEAVEKHIVSNVSDISSMGGIPMIAFLGLGLNRHWNESQREALIFAFQKGFESRGIRLLGGDTVVGDVGFFFYNAPWTNNLGTTFKTLQCKAWRTYLCSRHFRKIGSRSLGSFESSRR